MIIEQEPAIIEDLQVQAQEDLIPELPVQVQEDLPSENTPVDVIMEQEPSIEDTNLNIQNLDSKIQNFKEVCGISIEQTPKPEKELSDPSTPFYVQE